MSKAIDINSQNHYYCKTRPKEQIGLYKLLCGKYKIPVAVVIECLEEYRVSHQPSPNEPWSKQTTLDFIHGENFTEFLKVVTAKTQIQFQQNPNPKQRREKKGYDEWFEESSMDGSFAYNNSADDF